MIVVIAAAAVLGPLYLPQYGGLWFIGCLTFTAIDVFAIKKRKVSF